MKEKLRRHCAGTTHAGRCGNDKRWGYHKIGIDMSKAFDTIKRKQVGLLDALLQEAGCDEDDLRLKQSLLVDTRRLQVPAWSLQPTLVVGSLVPVNSTMSADFET